MVVLLRVASPQHTNQVEYVKVKTFALISQRNLNILFGFGEAMQSLAVKDQRLTDERHPLPPFLSVCLSVPTPFLSSL